MTLRIIDIETTGTDPATDAIVEIASVDLLKDGTIAHQHSTLVRPPIPFALTLSSCIGDSFCDSSMG
jgi:DNA polymerase III subunit epsilon